MTEVRVDALEGVSNDTGEARDIALVPVKFDLVEERALQEIRDVVDIATRDDVKIVKETVIVPTSEVQWLQFTLRAIEKLVLLGRHLTQTFHT